MLAALVLVTATGCASWSVWPGATDDDSGRRNPTAALKRVKRSIELESRFVQIQYDPADPDQLQSIWQWVDETVIAQPARSMLQRNGLRIGKAVQKDRLVDKIQSLQNPQAEDRLDQFLSTASIASNQSEGSRIIPIRLGKRVELPVGWPIEGQHVVLINRDPQPIGRTLQDPQFLLAITPEAGASSSEIRLRLRPEIQFGGMQMGLVKSDAAVRMDVRRNSWSLEEMEVELVGGEGDLFVITETMSRCGMGKMMLGGKDVDQMEEQTVVLLRIENIPSPAERL